MAEDLAQQVKALTEQVGRLTGELTYLRDRQDIVDCIYRYCRGLDRHDEDILASAFHLDAADNHGNFVGYIPEFVKWGNAGHAGMALTHTHNITTHNCEIDGDTAHTESYVMFCIRLKNREQVRISGGRYIDRLEKRPSGPGGQWKIMRRQLVVDWRTMADGRLWDTDAAQYPGGKSPYDMGTWDRTDPSYRRPFEFEQHLLDVLKTKVKPAAE